MPPDIDTSSSDENSDHGENSDHSNLFFWKRRNLEFRILISGRANAGKTTILERLAGASIDEAKVKRNGELLAGQVVRCVSMFAILSSDGVDQVIKGQSDVRFPATGRFCRVLNLSASMVAWFTQCR